MMDGIKSTGYKPWSKEIYLQGKKKTSVGVTKKTTRKKRR